MEPNILTHPKASNRTIPTIVETLIVFVTTYLVCGLGFVTILHHYFNTKIQMISGWESHLPMLVVPYIWYRLRVMPRLSENDRAVWSWRKGSGRLLFAICIVYVPAVFLLNLSALHATFHVAFGTVASAISTLLFQGVFVGLSEEMMLRPALQLPMGRIISGGIKVRKVTLSYSTLITALLFGGMHMINLTYQPFITTLFQSIYAFLLGVLFGYYYERTRNYLGAAILHSINDGMVPIVILLSSFFR